MPLLERIETALTKQLARADSPSSPPQLVMAMHHAVFPGGARIRPQLCLAVSLACGDNAPELTNAAACANDQGKFWEMHDRLFEGQNDWNTQATKDPVSVMKGYAKEIGLDLSRWQSCVDEAKHLGRIKGNREEALRRNIQSTPTFIIGDKMVPGAITYDTFKAYVDSAAAATTSPKAPLKAPAKAAAK